MFAAEAHPGRVQHDAQAASAVRLEVERAGLFGDGPADQPRGGFQHGDVLAGGPGPDCHLEPDEPAADHNDVPRLPLLLEYRGLRRIPQVVHPLQFGALERDRARHRAAGEGKAGEGEGAPGFGHSHPTPRIAG
nr:hypothetical protein [Cryobacterium sp. TMT2-15-1]